MAFVLSPESATVLEWTSVLLNIGFTILIGIERRVGWLLGFVASAIGVLLYAVENAWLMGALNGFYAVMGLYGWWTWGRSGGTGPIITLSWRSHAIAIAVGLLGTALLVAVMHALHIPGRFLWMEAFIAAFAIVATWLMSKKVLENWIYWTVGDVVAVAYNHWIGYDGYALLMVVYIVLAVVGYIKWSRKHRLHIPVA
jgi:nicotinamide mononucleotide transporter